MEPFAHLESPLFGAAHRELAARARAWTQERSAAGSHSEDRDAVDALCRNLVQDLGRAGFLRYCIRAQDGGELADFDVRSLALLRETLAWHDPLADFAFAMQGLGSAPISLAGSLHLKSKYLPGVAAGTAIAAFALSEPQAGSDVAAMECFARPAGAHYVLDGCKTWISNGGIADFYCVFARTAAAQLRSDGSTLAQGISAFVVDADAPGLSIEKRIDSMAPHPLAMLRFSDCRIGAQQRLGAEGDGFKLALRTLDIFRTSVAAAALGFARRALDEALRYARTRRMFGQALADFQLTQGALAEMATDLQAATLLTYHAAWRRDEGHNVTLEAAMAKMTATEAAQRVIDRALQMFGGRGVERGHIIERLYRDVRVLRIYEGATEVQKLIIARALLKPKDEAPRP
jgi:alkylation response protein AidB-like acyl-CoA dehydrogenase